MRIEAELQAQLDRWEHREIAIIKVLPFVLLAVSTVAALLEPMRGGHVYLPIMLALVLAVIGWLIALYSLAPERLSNRPLMAVYYVGFLLLTGALVVLSPWFGIFAFTGYVHAYLFLSRGWRYAGVAATSLITAISHAGGMPFPVTGEWALEWLMIAAVTTVLASTFFVFAERNYERTDEQKRALAALHEANANLEHALDENAALHAQLLTHAREAGVLDERQRIAQEIHDTLAQTLAGILTQLQAAEQAEPDDEERRRHTLNATALAREGLAEARRTVHAVEPQLLAEGKLPDAIREVVTNWQEHNPAVATLTVTGDARPLHLDVEVALLRAAQEALTNVSKHAAAGRVGLTLSYMDELVTLDVRDDGRGFDVDQPRSSDQALGGFGLAGMRRRVQRLAGRLEIESEPGRGTALSVSVPAIALGGES